MATFNGAGHLPEQLESIWAELEPNDQLIVVDDGSTDDTVRLLRSNDDPRLAVHQQVNRGQVRAFERAISLAATEVLVLADQDDVWPEGRLETLLELLDESSLAAGSLKPFGDTCGDLLIFPELGYSRAGAYVALALGRAPFYGSAMAFRRDVVQLALPFPSWIEAHDHWLVACSLAINRPRTTQAIVTYRRVHGSNLSARSRRSVGRVVLTRLLMARMALSSVGRWVSRR